MATWRYSLIQEKVIAIHCSYFFQFTQSTDAFLRFSGTARITINFTMSCLLLWPVASPLHTDICYQLNPINSDCPHSWCHSWLDDKYQPRLKPSLCGVNSSRDTVLALILPSSQSTSCQFLPIGLMAARSPEKLAISDKLPGCASLRLVVVRKKPPLLPVNKSLVINPGLE